MEPESSLPCSQEPGDHYWKRNMMNALCGDIVCDTVLLVAMMISNLCNITSDHTWQYDN
jgi:hypothetical protein